MNKFVVHIVLVFNAMMFSSALQGQTMQQPDSMHHEVTGNIFEEYMKGYYSQVFGITVTEIINPDLYNSIEKWLGTPYRYAGKTLQGIDCSAFVNKVYENAYCYLLEGNSAALAKQVTRLPKDKLKEGDLVFFRINKKYISHVGVYLGDNKFVHASRSNGVTISDLQQPYYRKYFVKGGRVNFPTN